MMFNGVFLPCRCGVISVISSSSYSCGSAMVAAPGGGLEGQGAQGAASTGERGMGERKVGRGEMRGVCAGADRNSGEGVAQGERVDKQGMGTTDRGRVKKLGLEGPRGTGWIHGCGRNGKQGASGWTGRCE